MINSYSAKFVPLNLLWLSSTESPLVHKIGKLLLHEFFNLCNGPFQAIFRSTRNVEVKRRILPMTSSTVSQVLR